MKIKLLTIILLLHFNITCYAQFGLEETANKSIDKLYILMDRLRRDALNQLDFISAQRVDQLSVQLQNFKLSIGSNLDQSINKLDDNAKNYLTQLSRILNGGLSEIRNLSTDMVLLSAAEIDMLCERMPRIICPRMSTSISIIQNTILSYQPNAYYSIMIGGSGLNQNSIVKVRIDTLNYEFLAQSIGSKQLLSTQRILNIPVDILNPLFKDTSAAPIKIQIYVENSRRRTTLGTKTNRYNINFHVLLLPKFPVKYELTELLNDSIWTTCEDCFKLLPVNQVSDNDATTFRVDLDKGQQYLSYEIESDRNCWCRYGYQLVGKNKWKVPIRDYKKGISVHVSDERSKVTFSYGQYREYEKIITDDQLYDKRYLPVCGTIYSKYDIRFKVKYERQSTVVDSVSKRFTTSYLPSLQASTNFVSYGEHLSEKLKNSNSNFRLTLYPYYWSAIQEQYFLSSTASEMKKVIPGLLTAEVIKDLDKVKLIIMPTY